MTTYTTSIPIGGGSFAIDPNVSAWCPLGTDKYLIMYQATYPSHAFAQVVKFNSNGLAAPTYGPTRVIRQNYAWRGDNPSVRVYGHSNGSAAVVLYMLDGKVHYQFLAIDASNNITEGAVTLLDDDFHGTRHMVEPMSDTKWLCMWNDKNGGNGARAVLTVDWSAKTLTMGSETAMTVTFTDTSALVGVWSIPGSTNKYVRNYQSHFIVNPQGQIVTEYTPTNHASWNVDDGYRMFPLSDTRLACAKGYYSSYLKLIDNGVAGSDMVASDKWMSVDTAMSIDANRYMLLQLRGDGVGVQVGRLMSPTLAGISPSTAKNEGIVVSTGFGSSNQYYGVNGGSRYHPSFHRRDFSTVVVWFIADSKLSYTVIYQPPVA